MAARALGAAALAVAAAVALGACGSAPAGSSVSDGAKPAVVTSTDVYAAVARPVGGELITVRPLIRDPQRDPHPHVRTPADAAAVAGAAVVVTNGGGYDDFVPELVKASGG